MIHKAKDVLRALIRKKPYIENWGNAEASTEPFKLIRSGCPIDPVKPSGFMDPEQGANKPKD